MFHIIDGHNLIPKVPGLHLADLDDEPKLIQLIQEYCRRKRTHAEIFFDGALAGSKQISGGGLVHVHSIREGQTADKAMIDYLTRQGKSARNCILVSSDRQVQNEARSMGCAVVSSEQFAADLANSLAADSASTKQHADPLPPEEVEKWLKLFNEQEPKI